ncbi:MAG: radical SAM protein, partial [Pseudomonadota bacterium]
VTRVFIGLENINPENLAAAKKKQNRIVEYREMLQAWKRHRATTYAGYILGFPGDTYDSIMRDIEIIKEELPLDLLEFFFLTPLPGSEDHKKMLEAGVWMDPDMNKYDLNHRCFHHETMSDEEWERAYRDAWTTYYSPEHMATIMRRFAAMGRSPTNIMFLMLWFAGSLQIEGVHPLEGGFLRRKHRRDRRPGMKIEPRLTFYPKYWFGLLRDQARWIAAAARIMPAYFRIKWDPKRKDYTDLALTPVEEEDLADLEMIAATRGGTAALAKAQRERAAREAAAAQRVA